MLEKVLENINEEYETLKTILDSQTGSSWALENPQRVVQNAQCRVLGVVMFAQKYLDVKYEDIEKPFDDFVKKIKKLEKNVLTNRK